MAFHIINTKIKNMNQLLKNTNYKSISALLLMLFMQVSYGWAQDNAGGQSQSSSSHSTTTTTETWMAQPWVWVVGGAVLLLLLVLLLRGNNNHDRVTITKTTDVV
jgi:hypothetical protein